MHKVLVLTGTRAEYGLLRPVLQRLKDAPDIDLGLIVTGAHLSQALGGTASEIRADDMPICAEIDILSSEVQGGRMGTAQRTALALNLYLSYLASVRPAPDALLLLGDRYEAFAAGQAAALLNIPLVHISGGDVTQGADDDWFRHCLTKMAKLHFTSCEAYRRRVIRMGEAPDRVFNVGGLGDENIRSMPLLDKDTLNKQLGFALESPYALCTFHPETQSCISPKAQAETLLAALDKFCDLFCLFTAANADAGGEEINAIISEWCNTRTNAAFVPSLGVLRYLSAMKYATLVVGNSSSGVVETSSFGVPTVDIGNRQKGRERGENVLSCALCTDDIAAAVAKAQSGEFAEIAKKTHSPYRGKDASGDIVKTLCRLLKEGALRAPKEFYDDI